MKDKKVATSGLNSVIFKKIESSKRIITKSWG
jgi:hypothetical protein